MTDKADKIVLVTPHGATNSGLRLLAAALRRAGFACDTIFFGRWINNGVRMPAAREIAALTDLIASRRPTLVGLGFGSPYLAWARWVAATVRDRLGVPLAAGGIHPTLSPTDLYGHADFICVGEGEEALVTLARALQAGRPVAGVPGLHVREGLGYRVDAPPDLLPDLDALPYRDFTDAGRFFMDGRRVTPGDPLRHARWLRVHGSRGCPFACAYCYNASLRKVYGSQGNRHRRHSVEWVLGEIAHIRRSLTRVRRILFDDDTFVFPQPWLDEFCARWPGEVGLPFDILAHPQALNEQQLAQLQRAGLSGLQVGIQAASRREVADLYHRTGVDQTLAFARLCRKLGIDAVYDIILDNPQADDTDREELFDLLEQMPRPVRLFLYSLNVFPQTGVADSLRVPPESVEGRSQISLRQFRLTLDWPRPPKLMLFAALVSLASKPRVNFARLRAMWRDEKLRRDPRPAVRLAYRANWRRLFGMGWRMLRRRELAWYKLREYAHPRRILTQ